MRVACGCRRRPCGTSPDGDKQGADTSLPPLPFQRGNPMKLVLTVLGVILLVIAAVYFLVPADQLPSFFPGYEQAATRVHVKHGIASGVVGIVLIAAGTWMGRK
jgi:hypothetical protein